MVAPSAEGSSLGQGQDLLRGSPLREQELLPGWLHIPMTGRFWQLFLGMGMNSWLFLEPVGHPGAFSKGSESTACVWMLTMELTIGLRCQQAGWGERGGSELHTSSAFLKGYGLQLLFSRRSLPVSHLGTELLSACSTCGYSFTLTLQKVQRLLPPPKKCNWSFFHGWMS